MWLIASAKVDEAHFNNPILMSNFKYNSKWILGNTIWHELSFFDDRTLEVENDVLATNDSTSLVIPDNNIDRLKSVGFWNLKGFLKK